MKKQANLGGNSREFEYTASEYISPTHNLHFNDACVTQQSFSYFSSDNISVDSFVDN